MAHKFTMQQARAALKTAMTEAARVVEAHCAAEAPKRVTDMHGNAIRCVEVWYNRNAKSWVVQPYDAEGGSYSSDYCGTFEWAMSTADGYGVPIVHTNTYGERMMSRKVRA